MSAATDDVDWVAIDDAVDDLGEHDDITPYMHWWLGRNAHAFPGIAACRLDQAQALQTAAGGGHCGEIVPLPDFALAPAGTQHAIPDDLDATTDKPPRDAVITGIIDEGIALGHARFRHMVKGKPLASRVLACWQQGARYGGPDASSPTAVPFGHTLAQHKINALLKAHSTDGHLDENAFNIAAGLTDGSQPMGITTLDRLVAHGSHVLDLAAGFDPVATAPKQLKRRPILAVTLPRREAIGMSGTFLHFFVVHAMQWIVDMADALWAQHYPDEPGGFPVALNLSFGQHAGPKNGVSQIEEAFRAMQKSRGAAAPLRLIMPAGNDNLARGTAYTSFAALFAHADPVVELPWRLQPEDHSPNFAELWVELDGDQPDMPHPLALDITLPTGEVVRDIVGQHHHCLDLPGAARVYAERTTRMNLYDPSKVEKTLFRYLICTAPTIDETGPHPASPAGVWRITGRWVPGAVTGPNDMEAKLFCAVQVDQAAEVGSLRNRRAYFDHSDYQLYDETGRLMDTFRYPYTGQQSDLLDGNGPQDLVQRRGTHNATATAQEIIVVGGYRESDGRPAPYSASYHADGRTPYGGATRMTAALPTETAPAHFGLRAAGPRSAATVALAGTSFAAGLATRQVVADLLAWRDAGSPADQNPGSTVSLAALAAQSEADGIYPDATHPLKTGSGRLEAPPLRDLNRLHWG